MDSKHGGSPASGLAVPASLDNLQPIAPGSKLVESPLAERRRANLERERQFERRRIAIEVMPALIAAGGYDDCDMAVVDNALALADGLMLKTPVPPRDEVNRE